MNDKRLPPCSEEAERGVLGSCLIEDERCLDLCIDAGAVAGWFYIPAHRLLFEILCTMQTEGQKVDLLTVGEHLKQIGRLEQTGGYGFLEGLIDSTPTTAHCKYYLEIVEKEWKRRELLRVLAEGSDAVMRDEPDDVLASLSGELTRIAVSKDEQCPSEIMLENAVVLKNACAGITSGLPLPWERFTMNTGGLQRASVVPLIGRDGKGKSIMLAQTVDFWLGRDIPTLSFSFEDVGRRFLLRMGACREWYSAIGVETGRMLMQAGWQEMVDFEKDKHLQKIDSYSDWLKDAPFVMYDRRMTVEQICSKIRHHVRTDKIEAVTIDGFKDIIRTKGDGETGREKYVASELQGVAKDTGVCILTVSHVHDVPDGIPLSKRNIMGSKVQHQGARQVLIFQDSGVDGADGVNTFVLDATKSNFGRGGEVLLRRDESVPHYEEVR